MDETISARLRDAGWSPNRRVDPTADLQALHAEGHPVWPELEDFLRQYSGLRIREDDNPWHDVWFSGVEAADEADPGFVEAYQRLIDTPLAPVGGYDAMIIFMGRDAKFYGGYDAEFGCLGASPVEVLRTIYQPPNPPALNLRVEIDR